MSEISNKNVTNNNTICLDVNNKDLPIIVLDERVRVHPAIHFTSTQIFLGLTLHTRESSGTKKDCLFLVTEEEVFPCTPENLERRKIELSHTNTRAIGQRWSASSVKGFLKKRTCMKPRELFEKIKSVFLEYVDFSRKEYYDLVTLWIIGTYFHQLFNSYPYIYVGGLKESGKTKLLTLCTQMGFNSFFSGSITTACLFRLVQDSRCSLFIDETEKLSNPKKDDEFQKILLNGYKKGGKVIRAEKNSAGNFDPIIFEVYSPKMVANISGLDNVLESRCICINMQKSLDSKFSQKEIDEDDKLFQDIRDCLYSFLLMNWKEVKGVYSETEITSDLSNRDCELWKPIFALAKFFDEEGGLLEEMKMLSVEKAKDKKNQILFTPEYKLFSVLESWVAFDEYVKLKEIRAMMWHEYDGNPYWLTEKYVGNLLRKMGFSKFRRVSTGIEYFITVSSLKDLGKRLGFSEGSECSEEDTGGW